MWTWSAEPMNDGVEQEAERHDGDGGTHPGEIDPLGGGVVGVAVDHCMSVRMLFGAMAYSVVQTRSHAFIDLPPEPPAVTTAQALDSTTPVFGPASPPSFDDRFRAQLLDLFKWRRDVRRFRADPVPPAVLDDLLEAACLAPSVGLSQPWRFVIVESPERRAVVRASFAACNARALAVQDHDRAACYARLKLAGLDEAPCHLAVFAEPVPEQGHGLGRGTMPETTAYSAVMAVHTFWLAARAMGLGLGWVSILDPLIVTAALDVPADWRFVGYFCLGYPQAESEVPELEQAGWEHRRPATSLVLRR